jgi:transcription initiation factor TFIIF subunit alpha
MAAPSPIVPPLANASSSAPPLQPSKSLGVVKRREGLSNPLLSRPKRRTQAGGSTRASSARAQPSSTAPAATTNTTAAPTPPATTTRTTTAAAPTPPAATTTTTTTTAPTPPTATTSTTTAAPTPNTEPEPEWLEFKLTTTRREILAGYKHHVMRLQSKRLVTPMDPEEFTMPVRLHRRDPQAPLQGAREQMLNAQLAAEKKAADAKDPELAEARAKKVALKAEQQAKIAPYGDTLKKKKGKTTQQVYAPKEEEKKLRYEGQFPWFVEDFDNKNTWQGQLENPLSNGTYATFVLDDGAFRMIPIENYYKFTEKNKFKPLSIEQAENTLKNAKQTPRWLMQLTKQEEKKQEMEEQERNLNALRRFHTRKGGRVDNVPRKSETADADDLDFEDDRFADDEETPIMEGDEEENREIENRIRKEQLSANVFDTRDENEYEEEARQQRRFQQLRKKQGKKVRKELRKREGNYTYETDSDENPYASSVSTSTTYLSSC